MTARVVFHIDDCGQWDLLLKNLQNLLRETDARSSRIEVVANAEAVKLYRQAEHPGGADTASELAGAGVRFTACRNALNGLGIEPEELFPFVQIVPSGVAELILRQQEGFAYIRP